MWKWITSLLENLWGVSNNLSMWVYVSTVNFMKSKYKLSMSDENLLSELKYILSVKYIPDFGDLCEEKI